MSNPSPISLPPVVSPATRLSRWFHEHRRAQYLAIIFVFGGLINLVQGILAKSPLLLDEIDDWMPVNIVHTSGILLVGVGLIQIILGRGLWRGKQAAWRVAVAVLLASILLNVGHKLSEAHMLASFVMLAAFLFCRHDFHALSDTPSARWSLWIGGGALLLLVIFGVTAFEYYRPVMSGEKTLLVHLETTLELIFLQSTDRVVPLTSPAITLINVIRGAAVIIWLGIIIVALRPVLDRPHLTEEEKDKLRGIIDQHGRDPLDQFAYLPDKRIFFHDSNGMSSAIAYALWRNWAVTLADPIGPVSHAPETIKAFMAFCRRQDWKALFYETSADTLPTYRELGFSTFKIAEDSRIDVASFSLKGGKFQNIRTAINGAKKNGLSFFWYDGKEIRHELESQLHEVSNLWLSSKKGAEMTFDLGSFSIESIREHGAACVVDATGQALAFATWLPYAQGKGRVIDLMRSRPEANGLMYFLIAESIEQAKLDGVTEISLANAPLANVDSETRALQFEEKAVRYVFKNFNEIYGYKSLFDFKEKFRPEWRGRYVAYPGKASLPWVALAIAGVHAPQGLWKMLKS